MDSEALKNRFGKLAVWKRKRKGERAPHKPLLILYALSQLLRGRNRLIPFEDVDRNLTKLLRDFGPSRLAYRAEFPFWRLQNDKIWEVKNKENVELTDSGDPKKNSLIHHHISGGFTEDIFNYLQDDDIIYGKRRPEFRERVLRAYEYRCSICGFDIRLDHYPIALEAAHIKWHIAGGPDTEINGLALCTMHHKLFDRGAFTLSENLEVLISNRVYGTQGFEEWLMRLHRKKLRNPQSCDYLPHLNYRTWHVREVFRGEYRKS
jgi:putative restriction endonuclease